MPSRRRRNQAPLSLFSFQDIITSVTAIMILLVLILTLELVTRAQQRGVAAEDRQVARELRETVATLQSRADALRAEQEEAARTARRTAGLSMAEIHTRHEEAERTVRLLSEENRVLGARVRAVRAEQRAAEREVVDAKASVDADVALHASAMDSRAAEMEGANLRERHRQDETRRSETPPRGGTLVFNQDPDNTRSPILLDVAVNGITVLAEDGGNPRQFAWRSGVPPADFRRWLSSLNAGTEYVVIMLRPSGIDHHDMVRDAVTAAGLAVGLELVGESMRVVLPAAGRESQ